MSVYDIVVEGPDAALFSSLMDELATTFQDEISNRNGFDISWKGDDQEVIRVQNSKDLRRALKELPGPVYDLFVRARKNTFNSMYILSLCN